jgi:hypothetical protein
MCVTVTMKRLLFVLGAALLLATWKLSYVVSTSGGREFLVSVRVGDK